MKSPSLRPPVFCHLLCVACCALSITLAFAPARAHADPCDPVIGLTALPRPPFTPATPIVNTTIEVPINQYIWLHLYVLNLGCTPLNWKVRDVEPGTQLDCPWISESPDSGAVSPAGSEPGSEPWIATITPFLAGGTHQTELQITSNDPVRPLVVLSLTIVVVAPVATQRHTLGQLKQRFRDPAPTGR